MKGYRSKEIQNSTGRTGNWLGFAAACLLAFAMAVGVTVAIYGNFDYNLIAGFNRQTKKRVWKIEARYSNPSMEEKTETLVR